MACIVCNGPTGRTHQCGKCGRHNHVTHAISDKVVHIDTGVAKHAWCSTCYTAAQQQPQQPMPVQQPPLPKQISEQASAPLPTASSIPSTIAVSGTGSLVTTAGSLARDNTLIASSMLEVPSAVASATASNALAGRCCSLFTLLCLGDFVATAALPCYAIVCIVDAQPIHMSVNCK